MQTIFSGKNFAYANDTSLAAGYMGGDDDQRSTKRASSKPASTKQSPPNVSPEKILLFDENQNNYMRKIVESYKDAISVTLEGNNLYSDDPIESIRKSYSASGKRNIVIATQILNDDRGQKVFWDKQVELIKALVQEGLERIVIIGNQPSIASQQLGEIQKSTSPNLRIETSPSFKEPNKNSPRTLYLDCVLPTGQIPYNRKNFFRVAHQACPLYNGKTLLENTNNSSPDYFATALLLNNKEVSVDAKVFANNSATLSLAIPQIPRDQIKISTGLPYGFNDFCERDASLMTYFVKDVDIRRTGDPPDGSNPAAPPNKPSPSMAS